MALAVGTVYMVNIPGIQAAQGTIDAFRTQDMSKRLEIFESTLALQSFAKQEIVEQLAQQAIGVAQSQTEIAPELREKFLTTTERELQNLVSTKKDDARLHVFLASYYRAIGDVAKAREQLAIARTLSPKKTSNHYSARSCGAGRKQK